MAITKHTSSQPTGNHIQHGQPQGVNRDTAKGGQSLSVAALLLICTACASLQSHSQTIRNELVASTAESTAEADTSTAEPTAEADTSAAQPTANTHTITNRKHGMILVSERRGTFVWDNMQQRWYSIANFWQKEAERRSGRHWGRRDTYPPYQEAQEHDSLIITLPSGDCLMEFFHERWRRANDVREWDPLFNEYGGCPHVFEPEASSE